MTTTWIIEAVDVFEGGHLSLSAGVPRVSPDQLSLNRFEECFNCAIIIAIAVTAHGYLEAVLAWYLPIGV